MAFWGSLSTQVYLKTQTNKSKNITVAGELSVVHMALRECELKENEQRTQKEEVIWGVMRKGMRYL